MRRDSSGRGPRRAVRGTTAERALEELVLTVALLDGPRASTLISGLSGAVRPAALELLRGLERCSRAERHARLARAIDPRPVPRVAEGIPGELGAEVREALAREASPAPGRNESSTARWARRILLEMDGW